MGDAETRGDDAGGVQGGGRDGKARRGRGRDERPPLVPPLRQPLRQPLHPPRLGLPGRGLPGRGFPGRLHVMTPCWLSTFCCPPCLCFARVDNIVACRSSYLQACVSDLFLFDSSSGLRCDAPTGRLENEINGRERGNHPGFDQRHAPRHQNQSRRRGGRAPRPQGAAKPRLYGCEATHWLDRLKG